MYFESYQTTIKMIIIDVISIEEKNYLLDNTYAYLFEHSPLLKYS
jgi:hypothetical protein